MTLLIGLSGRISGASLISIIKEEKTVGAKTRQK
jgi:hypothetical protein